MFFNRPVVKMEVKQSMRQTRPHPMLVTLLYLVIVGVGTWLISWLMNTLFLRDSMSLQELFMQTMTYGEDYLEYMLEYAPQLFVRTMAQAGTVSLLVSLLTAAWNGLMNTGYAGYCLDMSRNMNPPLEQIFSGFPRAGSAILAYILVAVFTYLWALLFTVGLFVVIFIAALLAEISSVLAILSILLILAAPILYAVALIWVSYRYVMVPFAIADSQNPLAAMDAIRASKNMMQGRKGSYFVLQISFIGWYLLEALVVMVGVIIALVSISDKIYIFSDRLDDMLYYGDYEGMAWLMTHLFAPILPIALVCGVVIFIINLWLTPYRIGCDARFYLYSVDSTQSGPYQLGPYSGWSSPYGGQPGQYGGQSGPYSSQPGQYGGQSGPYSSQPGQHGGQPSQYGSQSGQYGGQPSQYGSQSGPYGGQPSQYGSQSGPYGGQPSQYSGRSGPYGGQPSQYGSQSGSYSGQSGPYGGQHGPYNNDPYGYQPPSQSTFGGYTQGPQSPQHGTGTYTQWGAPQAPAAPAAPTVPETPVVPEPPKFPETVIASVFDQAPAAPDDTPAEPDDAPYEAPYAEPETSDDDEQPNNPSDPPSLKE